MIMIIIIILKIILIMIIIWAGGSEDQLGPCGDDDQGENPGLWDFHIPRKVRFQIKFKKNMLNMISQESVSLVWSSFCSAPNWEPQVYSTIWKELKHKESCSIHSCHISGPLIIKNLILIRKWSSRTTWQSDCLNIIIMIRIYIIVIIIIMIRTSSIRFRHPRPIDSWEGVKETKNLPNSCIQVAQCSTSTFLCNISLMSGLWNFIQLGNLLAIRLHLLASCPTRSPQSQYPIRETWYGIVLGICQHSTNQ